jgi:hypothetical protein
MHCACSCTESEQWWDDAKGVWQKVVFPSKRPANRAQVVMLEKWMTSALAAAATKHDKVSSICIPPAFQKYCIYNVALA